MICHTKFGAKRKNEVDSTGLPKDAQDAIARWDELKIGICINPTDLLQPSSPVFQELLRRWFASLQPRDLLEEIMSKTLFDDLARLERVDRAQIAWRIIHPHKEASRQEREVADLGSRLLYDPRGPAGVYGEPRFSRQDERDAQPTVADDSNDPARLVENLEATAAGCQWLLERWTELAAILEEHKTWYESQVFHAIRLMGRQPIDALDLPEIADIFLASHAINRQNRNAFTDLRTELRVDEIKARLLRMRQRSAPTLDPRNPAQGRQRLRAIVARATARLEAKAAEHRERAKADENAGPTEPAFDRTPAGQKLIRHKLECARAVSRAVNTLRKHRRDEERWTRSSRAADEGARMTDRQGTRPHHPPSERHSTAHAALI